MQIAGGFYREQCCVPSWDAMFGSGGRAAMAVSALSPGSSLHAYAEGCEIEAANALKELGIVLQFSQRPTGVVFSYFHPLSHPYIYPPVHDIARQSAIAVQGDAVLRFGFLEGDAIVDGDRVVYDPQTWLKPAPFGANGSAAKHLAIVLNELELRSTTGLNDIEAAALALMDHQGAEVVVAKGGIRGATVFERGGSATVVPAYRSSRVFKIGTGDVFSAIFTHFWAERGLSPLEAADHASRSVAAYCSSSHLPVSDESTRNLDPIQVAFPGSVLLMGAVNTLGQRYTMEEARFVLRELGIEVFCPVLDASLDSAGNAVLILADGLDGEAVGQIIATAAERPVVLLREGGKNTARALTECAEIIVADDFVSSIYFAAWAAVEHCCITEKNL